MVSRKLPSELEEEILTRVPLPSISRFRAVCKQWNALFNDQIFANNHLACARSRSEEFMLMTDSKLYSVSFNLNDKDPNIKVRKLPSFDISGLVRAKCDGIFSTDKNVTTTAVWNPWLKQTSFQGRSVFVARPMHNNKKIEIWLTKKKIANGDDVEWIKLLSVPIPNLPMLSQDYNSRYFIDDNIYGKIFVTCCNDETEQQCVYIVRGGICRKIILDDVIGEVRHCSLYVPSLMFPSP
ncbi:unnamed protein product [Microthlaspi erraticum]|uniref:F-box domain-containing protein n=1 Tax=Microthlaspi erraticum TaxID=1685480 RepID=A0A6D2IJS5_9BRAS|nr:unnamed protein product [Microthlaspi erraticum]